MSNRFTLLTKLIASVIALVSAFSIHAQQWTTSGTNIYNSNSGKVGIGTGTTAPYTLLEVKSPIDALYTGTQYVAPINIGWTNDYGSGGAAQWLLLTPYVSGGSGNPAAGLNGTLSFYRGSNTQGNITADYHVNIQAAWDNTIASVVPMSRLSPVIALHVVTLTAGGTFLAINPADFSVSHSAGVISYFGYYWNNYTSPQNIKPTLVLQSAATENISLVQNYQPIHSNLMYSNVSGNIGIGTNSPQALLHLTKSTGMNALGDILRINSVDGSVGNGGGILFTNNGDVSRLARIAGLDAGDWGGELAFYTSQGTGASPGGTPVERMRIDENGNVGIGTANPQSLLAVNGTITTKKVVVTQTGWSDFVFEPSYKLLTLKNVASYIKQYGHLPNVPSAAEVAKNGVDISGTQANLLQKIEELTLYAIEQDKKISTQETLLKEQQELLLLLKKEIAEIKASRK